MTTLGDDYPRQQERVRRCRDQAKALGPAGIFYVAVCDDLLRRADKAAVEQDLPAMLRVYAEMKELKE